MAFCSQSLHAFYNNQLAKIMAIFKGSWCELEFDSEASVKWIKEGNHRDFELGASIFLKQLLQNVKKKKKEVENDDDGDQQQKIIDYYHISCWDELPVEIMEMIVVHLNSVADSVVSARLYDNNLRFFDLSAGSIYNMSLSKNLQGGLCCGSSKGWLAMAIDKEFDPILVLFNPISSVQLRLPPVKTIPSLRNFFQMNEDCGGIFNITQFFNKIEVSSSSCSNCVVAATCFVHNLDSDFAAINMKVGDDVDDVDVVVVRVIPLVYQFYCSEV
ncbi:hypothetical protein Ddye_009498 [Dipteronia dyeriana]|uniref:KIB1-4 beta-propeller domain-containing protein n=1 Tax=Dipteronia dyeriana TaxID=168575 RepID=A0AAD9XBG6_9ROSI|nr:hypothetical protein Ddye_009498 [Dipteronia dyeriana]